MPEIRKGQTKTKNEEKIVVFATKINKNAEESLDNFILKVRKKVQSKQ